MTRNKVYNERTNFHKNIISFTRWIANIHRIHKFISITYDVRVACKCAFKCLKKHRQYYFVCCKYYYWLLVSFSPLKSVVLVLYKFSRHLGTAFLMIRQSRGSVSDLRTQVVNIIEEFYTFIKPSTYWCFFEVVP